MRNLLYALIWPILFACNKESNTVSINSEKPNIINALDLSFTPLMEQNNVLYYKDSTAVPILNLVHNKGINTIRVRLWNNPVNTQSALPEVMDFAKRIKVAGMQFWLDFHYSDTWADPGSQTTPKAWNNLPLLLLKDSIYQYTKRTLRALKLQNAAPDYIQVGNEINNGFLWPVGRINSFADSNNVHLAELLIEAIKACKEELPQTKIMIHYAGYAGAREYFQMLINSHVQFDIVGISYYPWWHGNKWNDLDIALSYLSTLYKPIVIAETAYPFTMLWNDWTTNVLGDSTNLIAGLKADVNGQANFIRELKKIVVKNQSVNTNYGMCYWAPEWVAYKGAMATDGSPWENLTLFDFKNKALPALDSLVIQ
ncbi:MAG: glycosyl hydrolase 53 family protein [Bacteroidota bacterium]